MPSSLVPPHAHAATVVAWCADSPFSAGWVPAGATPDQVLAGWHADPDVTGHLLVDDGVPVAYGELWHDPDEDEVELAHLVVDPARRRQGIGRTLGRALVGAAQATGATHVTIRVEPDNAAAIACYRDLGFAFESPADEERFNAAQPRPYRWLRHAR